MPSTYENSKDGALDRALAEPENARTHLAFAGAVDAVGTGSEQLPVPILLSMATVAVTRGAVDEDTESLIRGAALLVESRNVTVGNAAALAGLPASVISSAVEPGRCRSA